MCGTPFVRMFGMAGMVGSCGTLAFDRLDRLWFSFLLSNCYLWFTCKIKLYNTIDVGYLELQLDINGIFIGWFRVMVFNTTFNNISVISWWSVYIVTIVLLVEETWVSRENHRPVATNWQTLSHKFISIIQIHGCFLSWYIIVCFWFLKFEIYLYSKKKNTSYCTKCSAVIVLLHDTKFCCVPGSIFRDCFSNSNSPELIHLIS